MNRTITRLDAAGFPRNQLLDFLPDNEVPLGVPRRRVEVVMGGLVQLHPAHAGAARPTLVPANKTTTLIDQIAGLRAAIPPCLLDAGAQLDRNLGWPVRRRRCVS